MLASGEIPGRRKGQPALMVTENARGHEFDSRKSPSDFFKPFFGSQFFENFLGGHNFSFGGPYLTP
jgi:hypothetical protein